MLVALKFIELLAVVMEEVNQQVLVVMAALVVVDMAMTLVEAQPLLVVVELLDKELQVEQDGEMLQVLEVEVEQL
jgi:hypothetical protein